MKNTSKTKKSMLKTEIYIHFFHRFWQTIFIVNDLNHYAAIFLRKTKK